jgi:diacylglycerol kinase (ATP)
LVEIFGLKQGWHASFVLAELINAKHIAQVLHLFICLFLHWFFFVKRIDLTKWAQSVHLTYVSFK